MIAEPEGYRQYIATKVPAGAGVSRVIARREPSEQVASSTISKHGHSWPEQRRSVAKLADVAFRRNPRSL